MGKLKPRRGRPRKFRGETKAYAVRMPADLYLAVRRLAAQETRRSKKHNEDAAVVSINDVITASLRRWVRDRT